jgi:hypothetical protein
MSKFVSQANGLLFTLLADSTAVGVGREEISEH